MLEFLCVPWCPLWLEPSSYRGLILKKCPARNGGFVPRVKSCNTETVTRILDTSAAASPTRSQTSTTIPFSMTRSSRSASLANSVLRCIRTLLPWILDLCGSGARAGQGWQPAEPTNCEQVYANKVSSGESWVMRQLGKLQIVIPNHVNERAFSSARE